MVSFTEEAMTAGKRPATRLPTFAYMPCGQAPESVQQTVKAGPDGALLYMGRLRLADGVLVILEKRYVVAAHCPDLDETDATGSLYAVWSRKYGLDPCWPTKLSAPFSVQGADARLLEVREDAAGLLVCSVGYLPGGMPLWIERTL